ncbi:MAG: IS481 family transposase [Nesterenkonia sp.]|nr:IS481 family transposase [Nesterenkonia sp.]
MISEDRPAAVNPLIDASVRLAIAQWDQDAPRGAVTLFCQQQGISRQSFYRIRRRAVEESAQAAAEPRSRRPHSSPERTDDKLIEDALRVRKLLEDAGYDHGPISVADKMEALDLPAPSPATLARAFRRAGVVAEEPRKRPRSSWRSFVYPAPNDCWQIDATNWTLAGGRRCVIFQILDDHSRLQVGSLAAESESGQAAIAVTRQAIADYGVPQRFLSDNSKALNPSRRGESSAWLDYLWILGVRPITGKPYKPTTQGKNERLHRTLIQWLTKQTVPPSLAHLQAQLEEFEVYYNTERRHQRLPERMTPAQAFDLTPKAEPPQPPNPELLLQISAEGPTPGMRWRPGAQGCQRRKVNSTGYLSLHSVMFYTGTRYAGMYLPVMWDSETVEIADEYGEVMLIHPAPGTRDIKVAQRTLKRGDALWIRPTAARPRPADNGTAEVSPMS